jgi:hypothetical protein
MLEHRGGIRACMITANSSSDHRKVQSSSAGHFLSIKHKTHQNVSMHPDLISECSTVSEPWPQSSVLHNFSHRTRQLLAAALRMFRWHTVATSTAEGLWH